MHFAQGINSFVFLTSAMYRDFVRTKTIIMQPIQPTILHGGGVFPNHIVNHDVLLEQQLIPTYVVFFIYIYSKQEPNNK